MVQKVVVVEYDAQWPVLFATESDALRLALKEEGVDALCYHIGSTSIPGACAKPRVDIILAVPDLAAFAAASAALEACGYVLHGEYNIPFRLFFTKSDGAEGFNVHLYEADNPDIRLNCLFRDYLIAHPALLAEYCDLKRKLAQAEVAEPNAQGLNGYTLGKDVFIRPLMRKLDFHGLCVRFCSHYTEWEAVDRMHQESYPGKARLEREMGEHARCFLFYRGLDITGYAYWLRAGDSWDCAEWTIKDAHTQTHFRKRCLEWFRWRGLPLAE